MRIAFAYPFFGKGVVRDDSDDLVAAFACLFSFATIITHPHGHVVELLLLDELLEWLKRMVRIFAWLVSRVQVAP